MVKRIAESSIAAPGAAGLMRTRPDFVDANDVVSSLGDLT